MENFNYLYQQPKRIEPEAEKPKEVSESKFMKYSGHPEDVYESSINLANYLKENKIPNVMFLDRSARQAYVGLKEAWKKVGEDEIAPTIYFINPKELRGEEDFSDYKGEFNRKFKHLNREEAILVYDACIHSGDSLFATKAFLESLGFTDVKVGATSTDKSFSEEREKELDLIALDHRAHAGCHPFGHPLYVEHDEGHIVSQRVDSKTQRNRAIMEKQRIKDAFNDQYEKNNS
jgi:hypothetical protein